MEADYKHSLQEAEEEHQRQEKPNPKGKQEKVVEYVDEEEENMADMINDEQRSDMSSSEEER
jgi:hypothetical protein